jgi:hypothetical protein
MLNLLKMDDNVRGNIGEEIARSIILGSIRCQTRNSSIINNFKININQKKFLEKFWKYLDIVRYDKGKIEIFEVKTRKYIFLKNIWKKHSISPFMLELYTRALFLGFEIKVFEITFLENWNYKYIVKPYNKSLFSLSKTRGRNNPYHRNKFIRKM